MTVRGRRAAATRAADLQYVSASTLPSASANAIQVSRMCEAFAAAGRSVRLHARANRRAGRASASDVFAFYGVAEVFGMSLYRGRLSRDLRMGLRAAMTPGAVVYGRNIAAASISARLGRPVALEVHHPFGPDRPEHEHLRRLGADRSCLGIVAISHALAARLAADFPEFAGRILVAPDAANPVPPAPAATAAPREGFHVGYAGSLYTGKGFRRIVELARRLPWATFHVIGDTQPLAKRGVDLRQLPANVVMHGHRHPRRVGQLIAGFDVLLAPYRRRVKPHAALDVAPWMSPLKIFEYMSARKPIVAADLPVIREVLAHEETALLCSPDDDGAWTAALVRLARDPDLADRLAAEAYALWAREYTWGARARRILAWMDERLEAQLSDARAARRATGQPRARPRRRGSGL